MDTPAPNTWCTGSHSADVRKLMPNWRNAGRPPRNSERMMLPSSTSTKMPDPVASPAKIGSPMLTRLPARPCSTVAITCLDRSRHLLLPGGADRIVHAVRQRDVEELLGNIVTVRKAPVEELLHC